MRKKKSFLSLSLLSLVHSPWKKKQQKVLLCVSQSLCLIPDVLAVAAYNYCARDLQLCLSSPISELINFTTLLHGTLHSVDQVDVKL